MRKCSNTKRSCTPKRPRAKNTEKKKFDVTIIDPPRKGSTKEGLENVCKMTGKTIFYVSCNPQTLMRDLEFLRTKYSEILESIASEEVITDDNTRLTNYNVEHSKNMLY